MKKNQIYAAYGSNLNHDQMAMRCPSATFIGTGVLQNYQLVFRGVADIEHCSGANVPIGLWSVTEQCREALDAYEGYPRLYGRNNCRIYRGAGKYTDAFVYFMNADGYRPPSATYLKSIADGYEHCGLSLNALRKSLRWSLDQYERQDEFELVG
jgi:gamma-glutamylcyclotransferase (GGCT)/AIG2-like uncharacterized protein YtfP